MEILIYYLGYKSVSAKYAPGNNPIFASDRSKCTETAWFYKVQSKFYGI